MSIIIARQGDNKTLEDFKAIYNYCTEDFKTKNKKFTYTFGCLTDDPLSEMIGTKKIFGKTSGRQYTQMIISPTPINNDIADDQYMEMAKEIGEHYYKLGFHCNITVHFDTGKRHIHLLINSVSFLKSRKFSQSISQLNKFKFHCNRIFDKYGFDIIKMPTEKILDDKGYSFNDGYDVLEAYDEIAEDIAFNFFDVTENSSIVGNITATSNASKTYRNPDLPIEGGYNRFFAAQSEIYRDYYTPRTIPGYPTLDTTNAWCPKSELRPITPFNSANIMLAIIIKNQCASNYGLVDYFDGIEGPCMHIDNRRILDVYVPDTVNLQDLYSVFDQIPLRSEKEKNEVIRSATAVKAALNRVGDESKVSVDVSEQIRIHFDNGDTASFPDQNIVNVDYEEID